MGPLWSLFSGWMTSALWKDARIGKCAYDHHLCSEMVPWSTSVFPVETSKGPLPHNDRTLTKIRLGLKKPDRLFSHKLNMWPIKSPWEKSSYKTLSEATDNVGKNCENSLSRCPLLMYLKSYSRISVFSLWHCLSFHALLPCGGKIKHFLQATASSQRHMSGHKEFQCVILGPSATESSGWFSKIIYLWSHGRLRKLESQRWSPWNINFKHTPKVFLGLSKVLRTSEVAQSLGLPRASTGNPSHPGGSSWFVPSRCYTTVTTQAPYIFQDACYHFPTDRLTSISPPQ